MGIASVFRLCGGEKSDDIFVEKLERAVKEAKRKEHSRKLNRE